MSQLIASRRHRVENSGHRVLVIIFSNSFNINPIHTYTPTHTERERERECVCVCVCVCAIMKKKYKNHIINEWF